MEFAGQQIDYGYLPAAHTDGDLYLHLPKMNLLLVGGVASAESWPLLDYRNGAWLGGRVRAFERLAESRQARHRVVAGRRPCDDGRATSCGSATMYQQLFLT
jgi:hypothetical protein